MGVRGSVCHCRVRRELWLPCCVVLIQLLSLMFSAFTVRAEEPCWKDGQRRSGGCESTWIVLLEKKGKTCALRPDPSARLDSFECSNGAVRSQTASHDVRWMMCDGRSNT